MGTLTNQSVTAAAALPPLSPSFLRDWSVDEVREDPFASHKHLALIYDSQEEQLNLIIPYLRLGMARGEKAVYIIDDSDPSTVIAAMERHGIDVQTATETGALAILTKHDAYLKDGHFDPEWMIGYLAQAVEDANRDGFYGVRASGEMTWALSPTGDAHHRLLEYECLVDKFFAGHAMSGICQYNRRRFSSETLMHVIHTHPKIVFRGEICDNPYYMPKELHTPGAELANPIQRLLESMVQNTQLRRQMEDEKRTMHRNEKLAAADRMASTMSHEINNPLESISNLCYLMGQENLPPSARFFLETMTKEVERVSYITRQTVQFYRAGTVKERLDVASVMDAAIAPLAARAVAQDCVILSDDLVTTAIFGFAAELRQLFTNLLTNALEAGSTMIQIRISDGRDWKKAQRRGVRILVTDNGRGIPREVAGKAFEAFYTTKDTKGTGLGLWVGNTIVRKHEGYIRMRSRSGRKVHGTSMLIFLPID